jgi:Transposase IS66 family
MRVEVLGGVERRRRWSRDDKMRIDALFEIERTINGKSAEERLVVRQALSRPLIENLHAYMREQLAKLSRGHDLAKSVQLHPEAMGELYSVPSRRSRLSLQQRRRKRAARHSPREKVMAVLWI